MITKVHLDFVSEKLLLTFAPIKEWMCMDLNDCFSGMLCYNNHRNLVVSIQAYGLVFRSFTENLTFSYHISFGDTWMWTQIEKDGYSHKDYSIISHRDVTLILPRDLLKWSIHFLPWARQTLAKILSSGCQYIDYNEKIKFCHKGENLYVFSSSLFSSC